jgi:hypothetical protein
MMSNFYFPEFDCLLIHIPKTGGKSIRNGFFKGNYMGPFFGEIPEKYLNCFKFAFVRNPFDRIISAWKMFTMGTDLLQYENRFSLEEFLKIVTDESILYDERRSKLEEKIRHHTIPQTHPFNCLEYADFVGRYETLEEDFFSISRKIGVEISALPNINASSRKHYKEYFSESTKSIVEDYYQEDLERLNYAF